jgi:putrescine importer
LKRALGLRALVLYGLVLTQPGALAPRTRIPRNNILLVGAVALVGVFLLDYDTGAELLNFGAFVGFMGVNLSALLRYSIRRRSKRLRDAAPPLFGFLIGLLLWLSLGTTAKLVGIVWLALGLGVGAWQTRGFARPRSDPAPEPEPEEETRS